MARNAIDSYRVPVSCAACYSIDNLAYGSCRAFSIGPTLSLYGKDNCTCREIKLQTIEERADAGAFLWAKFPSSLRNVVDYGRYSSEGLTIETVTLEEDVSTSHVVINEIVSGRVAITEWRKLVIRVPKKIGYCGNKDAVLTVELPPIFRVFVPLEISIGGAMIRKSALSVQNVSRFSDFLLFPLDALMMPWNAKWRSVRRNRNSIIPEECSDLSRDLQLSIMAFSLLIRAKYIAVGY
jgi:hypothetical protein